MNATAPAMLFSRTWAMPHRDTFSVPPIGEFVWKYMVAAPVSADPFARNGSRATFTNDLDPATDAALHMDAEQACKLWTAQGVRADLAIFDPPYSPRQISECYKSIGLKVGMEETQNARLYKRVRDALDPLVKPGGIVLSFGWQSAGMGEKRGYDPIEILLVTHGGAHNDTICIAERKRVKMDFFS
jgi:hypothetical protein